ncbi:Uncharacterised protein [uncultured archaeon]|nr:Uncharacterised protein [uncultured archaeon]
MLKKRFSIWDILAWVILIGIALWVLLKVLGIINTPLLIEYAPIFGAVYLAGWAMHKLDTAVDEIKDLKHFAKETAEQINNIKVKCVKNHSD